MWKTFWFELKNSSRKATNQEIWDEICTAYTSIQGGNIYQSRQNKRDLPESIPEFGNAKDHIGITLQEFFKQNEMNLPDR